MELSDWGDYISSIFSYRRFNMSSKKPLEGLKVADFSWVIVGSLTTRYLSDHGATVVKIESHARPDDMRYVSPFKDNIPGIDNSGAFALLNSSKYSISLNLSKPKGREIAWKLIEWADLVAESFTPKQMKHWGLDYESVRKRKADIIYFSTTARGQYGLYALNPGYGPLVSALSSAYHLSGWADRGPTPPYGAYSDVVCPRLAVSAILAAVDYQRRTGMGQHIDQSQLESTISFFAAPCMDYDVNGRNMNRQGNRIPYAAPHGVFPCRGEERWCAIAVFNDTQWQSFCKAIGDPPWSKNSKFATLLARKQNEDDLERLVKEWTQDHTAEEVESLLQQYHVPASVVESCKDLYEDPQLQHRGHFRIIEHPVIGPLAYSGPAFRLSKTRDQQSNAPCLGEHNEFVLKELLGISDDQFAGYLAEGAITSEADLCHKGALV
jgi:crotonobetainyl-CoA:carnitine CoA-transferase CaiB-like acyl-CoA transferase